MPCQRQQTRGQRKGQVRIATLAILKRTPELLQCKTVMNLHDVRDQQAADDAGGHLRRKRSLTGQQPGRVQRGGVVLPQTLGLQTDAKG